VRGSSIRKNTPLFHDSFVPFSLFFHSTFSHKSEKNEKASEKMKKQLNKIQKTSEKKKNRVKK
jgi:hypothetical protein